MPESFGVNHVDQWMVITWVGWFHGWIERTPLHLHDQTLILEPFSKVCPDTIWHSCFSNTDLPMDFVQAYCSFWTHRPLFKHGWEWSPPIDWVSLWETFSLQCLVATGEWFQLGSFWSLFGVMPSIFQPGCLNHGVQNWTSHPSSTQSQHLSGWAPSPAIQAGYAWK